MTRQTHILVAAAAVVLCAGLATASYYRWEHEAGAAVTEPVPVALPEPLATPVTQPPTEPVRTETTGPSLPPCHRELAQLRRGAPTTVRNGETEELLFAPEDDGPRRVLESASTNATLVPGKDLLVLEGYWGYKRNPWIIILTCEDDSVRELFRTTGSPTITGNTLTIDTYRYGYDDAECCPYFDVVRTLHGIEGELVEDEPRVTRMQGDREISSLGMKSALIDSATIGAYAGRYALRDRDSLADVPAELILQHDAIFIARRRPSVRSEDGPYFYGQWVPHRQEDGTIQLLLFCDPPPPYWHAAVSADGALTLLTDWSSVDYERVETH